MIIISRPYRFAFFEGSIVRISLEPRPCITVTFRLFLEEELHNHRSRICHLKTSGHSLVEVDIAEVQIMLIHSNLGQKIILLFVELLHNFLIDFFSFPGVHNANTFNVVVKKKSQSKFSNIYVFTRSEIVVRCD